MAGGLQGSAHPDIRDTVEPIAAYFARLAAEKQAEQQRVNGMVEQLQRRGFAIVQLDDCNNDGPGRPVKGAISCAVGRLYRNKCRGVLMKKGTELARTVGAAVDTATCATCGEGGLEDEVDHDVDRCDVCFRGFHEKCPDTTAAVMPDGHAIGDDDVGDDDIEPEWRCMRWTSFFSFFPFFSFPPPLFLVCLGALSLLGS